MMGNDAVTRRVFAAAVILGALGLPGCARQDPAAETVRPVVLTQATSAAAIDVAASRAR